MAALAAVMAALVLVMVPGPASAEGAWATLELADVPLGTPIDVSGDTVTFRLFAHWGGELAGDSVLLVMDPLPEGWSYQVEGGAWAEEGFLLTEEGTVLVTLFIGETSEPDLYYVEPMLVHPVEGTGLTSVPVLLDVSAFYMVPVVDATPGSHVVPGQRLRWTVGVEASAPVDSLARLELMFAPVGWDVITPWRSAFIRAGVSEPVSFTVQVAEGTPPGEYSVMFGVRTADPRAIAYTAVETVIVDRVVGAGTANGDLHLMATVGGAAYGDLTLANGGNVPLTVLGIVPDDYYDLPRGWHLRGVDLPVTVDPTSTEVLRVGVVLPEDATRSPSGGHVIPVQLMTGTGLVDIDAVVEVFVPEVRDTRISVPDRWTSPTSTEMTMRLLLTDEGNIGQHRAVWFTHEASSAITYVELSTSPVLMRSGDMATVDLHIRVDPEATPGDHWVRLRAQDGSGLLAQVDVPVEVARPQLKLVGGLEVRATQEEGHYDGGDASMYVVTGTVENRGEEDLAFAKVEVYDTSSGTPVNLGYVPIYDLPSGTTRSFRFTLDRVRPGDNAVMAHPSVPGTNGDPYKNSVESRFVAEAVTPAPEGPAVLFAFAVALGSMAGLVAILATEAGRFALLAFIIIPLYTRLKPGLIYIFKISANGRLSPEVVPDL